jgi:hypothetical protein
MEIERVQLAERARAKMARMIGPVVLPGESREQLDQIASDDQYMAQQGYVQLRQGDRVWHTHIDDLTLEDSEARIEYERELSRWLKGRIKEHKKKDKAQSQEGDAEAEG